MAIQKVIVRIDKDGELAIFLPEDSVNKYNIGVYAVLGEHGEASMEYYRACKPANPPQTIRGVALYQRVCNSVPGESGTNVIAVKRDSRVMQKRRWKV